MATLRLGIVLAWVAFLLTGCGGAPADGTAASGRPVLLQSSAVAQPPEAYADAVQRMYIAYFGRPADPGGLTNFQAELSRIGAPTGIADIANTYAHNPTIRTLVDAFGTSEESNALYTGGTVPFVTAIYRNVFNREPDAEGLAFWAGAIDHAGLTRGNAALAIMAGALTNQSDQGKIDARIVINKTQVAARFTSTLVTNGQTGVYVGNAAAATARAMLSAVNENTDPAASQPTVDATIAALAASAVPSFASVQQIVLQRCAVCHRANPTFPGYSSPPAGIRLSNESEIRQNAAFIYTAAVINRNMPFNNATGMTEAERDVISRWFNGGMP